MSHKKDEEWIENCFRKMLRVQKKKVEKGEIEESTIYNYYKAAKVFCDQNRIRIGKLSQKKYLQVKNMQMIEYLRMERYKS